jgi:tRNA (guanine-N7-)-methyltransferase
MPRPVRRIVGLLMDDTRTDTDTAGQQPAGTRPIRTFHPRRGRMSARHADAMTDLWPRFGLTVVDGDHSPLDLTGLFGRDAPRVLEIGFGMGDSTAAMAAADPGRDYLAIEVHTPGAGNLLALIGEQGLGNVRVAVGDAMHLLHRLPSGGLDAVHIFFPDPWPKGRHHKRRLIQPGNVRLLRDRLRPGGTLHCATDWEHYAESMAETLGPGTGFVNPHGGFAPRPEHRPVTKFERRGVLAGRQIFDLVVRRAG